MSRLLVFLSCFIVLFLEAGSTQHLILHFDVNKTLIATDKTENKTFPDVINELLSRKYSACWDDSVKEPITFDAYVRTVLMPGEEHDAKLKEERLVHLIHFIDFLQEHRHPLYPGVLNEFQSIMESSRKCIGNIFPSFYRLIDALDAQNISYTIFLRSFGKEVFEIKNEMNAVCKDLFKINGSFQKGILYVDNNEPLKDISSISQFFHTSTHAAIRDDWKYWMEGEMEAKCGKLFPLDPDNENVLSIFFDDNIKIDSSEKNIIGPVDSKTGNSLSILSLIQSKQLVSVDTIEALLNENYFIEYVQEAINIHALQHPKK